MAALGFKQTEELESRGEEDGWTESDGEEE